VRSEVRWVRDLANDAQSGIHSRHATATPAVRHPSQVEVSKAVAATIRVLRAFQIDLMTDWENPDIAPAPDRPNASSQATH